MIHTPPSTTNTRISARLVAAGALALVAMLAVPPADAHERRHRHEDRARREHHGDRRHGHGDKHFHRGPARHPHHRAPFAREPVVHYRYGVDFRVPSRIPPRIADAYRPYIHDRVYYRPHRHRHVVYRFPVATARGYVYRSHHYCDGRLFEGARITYRGRHVSFGVSF